MGQDPDTSEAPRPSVVPRFVAGGGEMGALVRALDWDRTPVGAMGTWPQSLRTAVSMLLESRFGMMIAWGPDFTQFYNDPFRPILGTTKHPALGKGARDTFSEAWHLVGPLFDSVMAGSGVGFEDMMVPLDRNGYLEECFFHYSYSPIRDESGGVGGVLVTVAETTARVLAERRLRTLRDLAFAGERARSEVDAWAAAAAVLASAPADLPFAAVYVLDADGRSATLSAEGPTSFAPARVALDAEDDGAWPLGAATAGASVTVDDVRRRFGDHAGAAWPEPVRSAVVLPVTRPGLPRLYGFVVAGVSPRLALDERYRDFLSLAADQIATSVANARAYEDERRRAEALVDLDRQKTAFFSNVSHEFRTPLTLMIGPTEDALSSPERALRGAALEAVHRNELRLLKLVNALLDFSRIEAGRMDAAYEPTDLAALTRHLASSFGSALARAGLRFEVDCPPLRELVYVDREMWEKVVLNLLSNALKFTLEGGVTVSLREAGAGVELRVTDTGVGIAADELPRVFERFHRVEGQGARTHEGSGIGLALVHELVRMNGGEVAVASEPGRGSTFTVSLPYGSGHLPADRVRASAVPGVVSTRAAAFVEEALRWGPAGASPEATGGVRGAADVLIVDDNADMREYLARLVGQRWTPHLAADGQEALEMARRRRYDLVLTDVMMPRLDGVGLLRALRSNPSTAATPVVMLSARAGEDATLEGLQAGADDYLVKPFSAREVIARVATQLQVARLRREAELERERFRGLAERERRARAEAESANRAKDAFLAMLGHELRNPLAPILTSLHLMRSRGGDSREQQVIERQIGHLTRLVDDLLDVSRIAGGKVELRRQPVELWAVVQRGVEIAGPTLSQRRQRLDLRVPPTGLVVLGDGERLAQVISNLVVNAAKYSDPGRRVTVTAGRVGQRAELRVRDEGIGIARDMLDRVFDLFYQQDQALERASGGLGLGLAIVRSLVTLHGGEVVARSDGPGRGSEFVVTLPLHDTASEDAAPAARPSDAPDADAAASRGGKRVLVVDDNDDAAAMLADTLRDLGYEAETARDGPTALRVAGRFKPHVALLDIGLPVMDGYELGRLLRGRDDLPQGLRLVALTGFGQASDRDRSQAAGFDDHLVKPVTIEVLTRAVDGPAQDNG